MMRYKFPLPINSTWLIVMIWTIALCTITFSSLQTQAQPPFEGETNTNLRGIVWEDSNANGFQDTGEIGMPNISIELWQISYVARQEVREQKDIKVSDQNGRFRFRFIPPPEGGNYYLKVNRRDLLDAGYAITTKRGYDKNSPVVDSEFDQWTGETDANTLYQFVNYTYFGLGLVKIPECNPRADIVIALDFSHSISGLYNDYRLMKNFAQLLVRGFQVDGDGSRISVVQFSRPFARWNDLLYTKGDPVSRVEIHLNDYDNRGDIIDATALIVEPEPDNRNHAVLDLQVGLKVVNGEFIQNGNPMIPDRVILVTDGFHTQDPTYGSPFPLATTMRNNGIVIFGVQLAPPPRDEQRQKAERFMQSIVSPPLETYLFPVNGSQQNLISVLINLINQVCVSQSREAPIRNYYTTPSILLSWSRIDGAESYEVQVADNAAFENSSYGDNHLYEYLVSGSLREVSVSLPDGIYFWRVRAVSGNRVDEWNFIDSFIVDAVP